MPTLFTHAVVGLCSAGVFRTALRKPLPKRFWVLSAIFPAVPDADVAAFLFGIPYEHILGHRGFWHSFVFAGILATYVLLRFFRDSESPTRTTIWLYFTLIISTHGLLDACTNGGHGIALLSPFNNGRYFLPWRPILVSPIGVQRFFSEWGMKVLVSEFLWVWLPSIGILLLAVALGRLRR